MNEIREDIEHLRVVALDREHEGLNDIADRMEKLLAENATMRKHLVALHIYVTGEGPEKDFQKFAGWYPRTWNAIVTDNPTSFDLPESDSDCPHCDDGVYLTPDDQILTCEYCNGE